MNDLEPVLKELFGSESRYRVLRAFYRQPAEEFHLRGLAANAGVDPGNLHKMLQRLVELGLCEQVAAQPYSKYRVSRASELFEPMSLLFSRLPDQSDTDLHPMKKIEDRSLALHRQAVRILNEEPGALDQARSTLDRWIEKFQPDVPSALNEWRDILSKSKTEIARIALGRSERAARLRKSSPLSPLVPAQTRKKIYASHRP